MLKTILVALSLFTVTFAQAELNCPKSIQLQDPRFLGGQEYPSFDQLKANFDQSFTLPGNSSFKTWDEADLQTAHAFVTVLKRNMVNHTVTLNPHAGEQVCEGSLENLNYRVDDSGVVFDLNFRNTIGFRTGEHQAVNFWLALPSNCSGCSGATEIFEFSRVKLNY